MGVPCQRTVSAIGRMCESLCRANDIDALLALAEAHGAVESQTSSGWKTAVAPLLSCYTYLCRAPRSAHRRVSKPRAPQVSAASTSPKVGLVDTMPAQKALPGLSRHGASSKPYLGLPQTTLRDDGRPATVSRHCGGRKLQPATDACAAQSRVHGAAIGRSEATHTLYYGQVTSRLMTGSYSLRACLPPPSARKGQPAKPTVGRPYWQHDDHVCKRPRI